MTRITALLAMVMALAVLPGCEAWSPRPDVMDALSQTTEVLAKSNERIDELAAERRQVIGLIEEAEAEGLGAEGLALADRLEQIDEFLSQTVDERQEAIAALRRIEGSLAADGGADLAGAAEGAAGLARFAGPWGELAAGGLLLFAAWQRRKRQQAEADRTEVRRGLEELVRGLQNVRRSGGAAKDAIDTIPKAPTTERLIQHIKGETKSA